MTEQLESLVVMAVDSLERELGAFAPGLSADAARWMRDLARSERPADYFLQPDRFPVLKLPWWLQASVSREPNLRFHGSLAYSTVSGYYFIRLIDNVMDRQGVGDRGLLPLLGFFHTEFQTPYQEYFPSGHPFWDTFRSIWLGSLDAAFLDAGSEAVDRRRFVQISARKVGAAKIPLAAAGHRLEAADSMSDWFEFCDLLGCFEQFMDDLFDWRHDLRSESATYYLSEARRRKRSAETVAEWVVRDGFEWGVRELEGWLIELESLAERLGSREVEAHLRGRARLLRDRCAQIRPVFRSLHKVAGGFALS